MNKVIAFEFSFGQKVKQTRTMRKIKQSDLAKPSGDMSSTKK